MESLRIEIETLTNQDLAVLYESFLSVESVKLRLVGLHRFQHGPNELDKAIIQLEELFGVNREKLLASTRYGYWLLLGMTYKLSLNFSEKCIEALSKAIKMKWDSDILWNEVGEMYWITGDKKLAKICFDRALDTRKNPRALRNLSMVVRNMGVTMAESIEEGIRLAKDAVELDVDDCESWTVLGNSYLAAHLFFNYEKKYALESLKAFKIAEQISEPSLDLNYNTAVAFKCLEKYGDALEKIEACLMIDSNWKEAISFKYALEDFVSRLKSSLAMEKTATKEAKTLPKAPNVVEWQQPNSVIKLEYFSATGRQFIELKEGLNNGVMTFGRIIWVLRVDDSFPYLIGLLDSFRKIRTVHIFNVKPGNLFRVGDGLSIRNPIIEDVSFKFRDETIEYPALRVMDPSNIAINGKGLTMSSFQKLEFTSTII